MVLDSDALRAVMDKNPRMAVEEIAEALDMPNSTIFDHLKRLNYVNRCDVWVPRELTARQRETRFNACVSLVHRANGEGAQHFWPVW